MQQRYYDPIAGRFLSVDPVVTDAKTGSSFNRYVYGNNIPYKFKDPDGRFAIPLIPLAVDALIAWGTRTLFVASAAAVANIAANQSSSGTGNTGQAGNSGDKGTPLPGGLVGVQDGKSGPQGNRHNSGPLAPENGGTGDAGKDFGKLTGGKSGPAPEGSGYPKGTQVGENGVALRPEGKAGPRIDVPANGDKPHETLHYPKADPK